MLFIIIIILILITISLILLSITIISLNKKINRHIKIYCNMKNLSLKRYKALLKGKYLKESDEYIYN